MLISHSVCSELSKEQDVLRVSGKSIAKIYKKKFKFIYNKMYFLVLFDCDKLLKKFVLVNWIHELKKDKNDFHLKKQNCILLQQNFELNYEMERLKQTTRPIKGMASKTKMATQLANVA
jgi:hypothetical protein